MTTLVVYDTISGDVRKQDAVYATAHDAVTGTAQQNIAKPAVECDWTGSAYGIYRSVAKFDLSSLPVGTIISSAIISLYAWADSITEAFNIVVVSGTDLADPLVDADYGDLLNDTTSYGSIASSAWVDATYNNITLNATGITAITPATVNFFAFRNSLDINNTTPTGFNYVQWQGAGYGNDAYITITYGFIPKIFYF